MSYRNNKFKISGPTRNEKFELSNGSDIQDYFEYIVKNYETLTDNPPLRIYVNKIENSITFEIKRGFYLKPLTPEAIKLLGSTKSKITKNEKGENVPNLEITEVILVHCNVGNNNYQRNPRVLHTFVPNKSFGQLLDIPLKMLYF